MMVNTLSLPLTALTVFETDPEDGSIVYSVEADVNDVGDTSSLCALDGRREIVKGVVLGALWCAEWMVVHGRSSHPQVNES